MWDFLAMLLFWRATDDRPRHKFRARAYALMVALCGIATVAFVALLIALPIR
jgi:hypothetical protein